MRDLREDSRVLYMSEMVNHKEDVTVGTQCTAIRVIDLTAFCPNFNYVVINSSANISVHGPQIWLNMRNLRNSTMVLNRSSSLAYVNRSLVFSKANRFSNPISHAIPKGNSSEGGMDSLIIGIRALGSVLTW